MNTKKCLLILTLTLVHSLHAQWAVLEDDPRPRNPSKAFEVFSKEEWNKSNFAAEKDLQWFRDAKFGMFIHFGLSAYKNVDLSWGVCKVRKAPDRGSGPYPTEEWTKWKDEFHLPDFDAKKIVEYAQDAGMKYIVVIAKHHDGFHMWDTALSDFKITNTPFGRDYLKEIADACHKAGMKFGIYYSQRDWYHPDYNPTDHKSEQHKRYIEYQNKAVRELCTNYGKVDVFWFDAVYWNGMFHAAMWDSENLTRMIRTLQPGILINNRANLPGDFDTPEKRIGMFQNHRPWESCVTICRTWSYSETPTKSPKEIVEMLVGSLCGDGNILMSWGPKWSGEFAADQVASLKSVGTWVKKNEKAIYGTRGGPWTPKEWGGSVHKDNSIYLHITSMPAGGKLFLSGLKQKILKAAIHGGDAIPFTQEGDRLEITVPSDKQDSLGTVVELTIDSPITEIIATNERKSIFNDPAYGRVLSDKATLKISTASPQDKPEKHPQLFTGKLNGNDFAFATNPETRPHAIIDLGAKHSIRGILIQNPKGQSTHRTHAIVSLSSDGKAWEEINHPLDDSDIWEIPVTRFEAGAHVPGKDARFVKIERQLEQPGTLQLQTVKIFGK